MWHQLHLARISMMGDAGGALTSGEQRSLRVSLRGDAYRATIGDVYFNADDDLTVLRHQMQNQLTGLPPSFTFLHPAPTPTARKRGASKGRKRRGPSRRDGAVPFAHESHVPASIFRDGACILIKPVMFSKPVQWDEAGDVDKTVEFEARSTYVQ